MEANAPLAGSIRLRIPEIQYIPIRRKGYWELELDKITFGEQELELEGTGAAIDTGTSLIVMPSEIAEILNNE